jgi:hypothetical protein
VTNSDIAHQRLRNQHLAEVRFRRSDEIVGWLAAAQAQDYAGAKWALGLRLHGATDDDLDQALANGTILRTHLLRPTWHFVTPADIRWMLELTAPRIHAANAHMYRKLELDREIFKRSHDVMARALQGNNQLTRDELRDLLQKAGIETGHGLRLAYLMMCAELDGLICSGGRQGKQFTYALLSERAPQAITMNHEAALAELARRYFMSRGPATMADFSRWSGLTLSDARRGLEAVKTQLEQEVIGEQTYWFPASTPSGTSSGKDPSPLAHLLSIYDEYISGYKDRSAVCSAEVGERLKAMGNAVTYIVVLDGQIVGSWKRTLRKDAAIVETNLFSRLTKAQNGAVAAAVQQYGKFLGLPAELV